MRGHGRRSRPIRAAAGHPVPTRCGCESESHARGVGRPRPIQQTGTEQLTRLGRQAIGLGERVRSPFARTWPSGCPYKQARAPAAAQITRHKRASREPNPNPMPTEPIVSCHDGCSFVRPLHRSTTRTSTQAGGAGGAMATWAPPFTQHIMIKPSHVYTTQSHT